MVLPATNSSIKDEPPHDLHVLVLPLSMRELTSGDLEIIEEEVYPTVKERQEGRRHPIYGMGRP